MIIVNLVLSLLVLSAVYGLTWFAVTALEPAKASAPQRIPKRFQAAVEAQERPTSETRQPAVSSGFGRPTLKTVTLTVT
jgi:hypothetical protein